MSQLRFDYTSSDWVVFAPLRKLRPQQESPPIAAASAGAGSDATASCPFCPGNERLTPQEIYSVGRTPSGGESSWRVRVVANKFPALRIEEDHHRHESGRVFEYMGGCGAHEVVIESPDHQMFPGQQPIEQIELILRTLHARYQDLMRDRRFQSIIIFKNHGVGAGTSLRHPHWQIIATPVVPQLSRQRHLAATEYFDRTGECLYCVMAAEELAAGERIIATNDEFIAFVPYAAHLPFENLDYPSTTAGKH